MLRRWQNNEKKKKKGGNVGALSERSQAWRTMAAAVTRLANVSLTMMISNGIVSGGESRMQNSGEKLIGAR